MARFVLRDPYGTCYRIDTRSKDAVIAWISEYLPMMATQTGNYYYPWELNVMTSSPDELNGFGQCNQQLRWPEIKNDLNMLLDTIISGGDAMMEAISQSVTGRGEDTSDVT